MNNMCNDLELIVHFETSPKHCTEHLGESVLKIDIGNNDWIVFTIFVFFHLCQN